MRAAPASFTSRSGWWLARAASQAPLPRSPPRHRAPTPGLGGAGSSGERGTSRALSAAPPSFASGSGWWQRSSGERGTSRALSAAPPSFNSRSGWCSLERRARHLSRALRRATALQLPVRVEHQLLKIRQKITVTARTLNVSHVSLLAERYETAFQDFPKNSKFLRKFF